MLFHWQQQTQQGPKGIFTLGVAGATILMGVKTAWTRKRATRMMHTSRSDWVESERGVNDV